ncbi:MAG: arginine--tRNA ligase [Candidatus Nealsonbacteria bacterium]|nr:arginine--tRNA ligase [Candidatus Nealsonbacteria bacterium]
MIRQDLIKLIKEAISEANLGSHEVGIDRPEDKIHGDYSTGVALKLAKMFKMAPMKIAENLQPRILRLKPDLFSKIEIAEPGFINFFISPSYLQNRVKEILKEKEKFGEFKLGRGQKVNIEFVSANPTGQLHIGNGRSAFAGDSLANVLEKAGFQVVREYFINDAKNSKQIMEFSKTALGRGETYLNDYVKSKIDGMAGKKNLDEGEAGYLLAQEVQKDTKEFLEKKLKIRFNKWVSEEEKIYRKNRIKKILDWFKKNNLVYEKDGALWLKTSQFGDEKDWVVIRETGEPTYLLSDIAYHKDKFDGGFNRVIDIWGADHQAHVSKMKAVAKMLGFRGNLDILVLQLVTLRGGEKMSKRVGNIITLQDLVDEIGLDVARWFYLQKSLNTHTEIDLDLAKEQSEKNPVFYAQYAHARICSILSKFGKSKIQNPKSKILKLLNHPSELSLIKQLIRFQEIIEDTANDYQIQRLPQYATDLATSFHQFYQDCRVISEDKKLTQARLSLVLAAKIVLGNTLSLMGISSPEKM